jgi:hypothetical protein
MTKTRKEDNMNASISDDSGTKVKSAQVCKTCGTTTIGKRYSVSGHGSGSKPGKAPGELREPEKVSPGSGAKGGGMTFKKVSQST